MRSQGRRWWFWLTEKLDTSAKSPVMADRVLLVVWLVTRLILLLGMIIGAHYSDPQFYKYAGEFATGKLPYRDFAVEYPPVAMVLLLVPALMLLPFSAIAPRPDPAFVASPTALPAPDPMRYSVYGLSFGIEMLLIDLLTLLLVRAVARRLIPGDRYGMKSGLVYLLLIFASGALLQKFDLVAGTLCLAAILALVNRRNAVAFICLGFATLIKGFPVLLVPVFLSYLVYQTDAPTLKSAISGAWRRAASGLAWFAATLAAWTLLIVGSAGWHAISQTILYQARRGIEIESLFANAELLVGWLPGLAVHTDFSPSDLSRVVHSALDRYADTTSVIMTLGLVSLAYIAICLAFQRIGRTARPAAGSVEDAAESAQKRVIARGGVLMAGSSAVLLAFMLSFLALPAHYLLVVIPLLACVRLASRRSTVALFATTAVVALLGQIMTVVWPSLRNLQPWAVAILTGRNLAWLAILGVLGVALVRWPVAVEPASAAEALSQPRRSRRAPLTAAGRALTVKWRRRWQHTPPLPGFSPRGEDVFAHILADVSPLRIIVVCGLISTLVYTCLVAAFPLTLWWSHPHASDNPNVINDMGRITGYSAIAAFGVVLAIILLFGSQFFALIAAGRVKQLTGGDRLDRLVRWCVIGFPLVFTLIMIWMQPVTTTDLYGYVARGYLQVHFHANPMVTKASLLPGGLSVDRPEAPYGPVWLLITAAVALVAGENLFLNMLIFKIIAAVSAIAAFILVDWLARRLYPARRLRILVLFGWSPLLLFETIGNGHNDIVMMVCVLGAFLCMLHGRARTAFMLLVLGALVKYVSAVFVPLWLVYELRHLAARRRADAGTTVDNASAEVTRKGEGSVFARATRATIQAVGEIDKRAAFRLLASVAVIGLVLVIACYAPYWDGLNTFTGLGQQLRPLYYNGSIVGILAAPLQIFVPSSQWPALDKTVRLVFYTLFALYAFFQVRRLWSLRDQSDLRDVITASAKITFAALVLITFWFQPWYVIWLLPLAPLANEPFVRRQGIMLAMGALLTYAVSNFLLIGESDASRDLFVQFFEILVTFAPLLFLRAAPYEQGWFSVVRRYAGAVGEGLSQHAVFWERAMLVLVLIVAAMLRLLHLGNLLAPLPTGSAEISTLKEISSDLKLVLIDPQGLHGPFVAIQKALVYIFGPTPLAALLPSAVIGTLTVYVIYLLAREILRQGQWKGASTIALLSALLAATSRWHVSLSRSGMEVILLPLLMCTATLWLLMALRLSGKAAAAIKPGEPVDSKTYRTRRRALLLYAGCGICTGLACDLAPGLWLLPMLVLTFLVVWRLRHPHLFKYWRQQLAVLVGVALVSGLPVIGYFLSLRVGLPPGSPLLARSSVQTPPGPGILSLNFWGQVLHNVGDVLRLLISQDYTSGYPAVGPSPIIPVILTPIFIIGLVILLVRWKNPTAMALLLLTALPLVASIAIGASTGVIEAASVLPATCIIPALALYEIFTFLGHLPIVLDRMNGVRVFTTPEQIGRVLLLLFLVVSTIRTFFWYFEATLPSRTGSQQTPTWTAPKESVAQVSLYGDRRIATRPAEGPVWELARR
jgi:alpha-1,6-mannosyltransferase